MQKQRQMNRVENSKPKLICINSVYESAFIEDVLYNKRSYENWLFICEKNEIGILFTPYSPFQ